MQTMRIEIVNRITDVPPCDVRIVRGQEIMAELSPDAYRGTGVTVTPLYACDGYLCASAVTADGVVTQRAITQNAVYAFSCGDALEAFTVGDTLCALAVDTDALRPEVFRALALRGVKVVFCVRLTPQPLPGGSGAVRAMVERAGERPVCGGREQRRHERDPSLRADGRSDDQSGFLLRGEADPASFDLPTERFYEGQRSFPVFQSLNRALFRSLFGRDPR